MLAPPKFKHEHVTTHTHTHYHTQVCEKLKDMVTAATTLASTTKIQFTELEELLEVIATFFYPGTGYLVKHAGHVISRSHSHTRHYVYNNTYYYYCCPQFDTNLVTPYLTLSHLGVGGHSILPLLFVCHAEVGTIGSHTS